MTEYVAEYTLPDGSTVSAGPLPWGKALTGLSSKIATKSRRDGGVVARLTEVTHPYEGMTCGILEAVKGLSVHVAIYDVD